MDRAAAPVEALLDTRSRLIDFARACTDEQWAARPLGEADPRPVSVIVDHVADADEYLTRWSRRRSRLSPTTISPTGRALPIWPTRGPARRQSRG